MITHPEYGLLVFVDASPEENLDLKSNSKKCFVAAVCDHDDGLPDFHDFKTGSWKMKLKRARALTAAIADDSISFHAQGFSGRQKSLLTIQ